MKLSTVKSEGLSKEFKVVIPVSDIQPVFESKLAAYAKNFSMPGFRKGKVPAQHVKARYGYRAFQEAAESLIDKTQRQALEQEKIKALAAPKISVSKLENETTEIEYTLSVDVMPELPTLDLKNFKPEKLVPDVSDKDVQSLIEEQFKDFPMYKDADAKTKAALGTAVRADVIFKVDGKSQKPTKGARIELVEAQKDDKIVSALIGVVAGDEKNIAFDPIEEKGKKKNVECIITVLAVLEKTAAKFDDDFAKELGFESFSALKEHTLKSITGSAEAKSRACLKRELLDHIDLQAVFEVPSSMVEAELESILLQVKSELTETEKKETNDEALRKEYMEIANRRVRLGLLLSDIGNNKDITVSNQEISQELYRISAQTGTDVKKLVDYIKQNPAALNSIQAPLFEEKVVDALLSEMKLTEKKVSLKDLDKYYDDVLSSDMPEKAAEKK
ncbi:MAG: trigger factor [Alphaproteobacteria bacterium]|nr:trigger factor [Alphaproteobacteria bacterium]